jgi:hypothetical protein
MAVAFHLLAHRNPAQAARLLKAIWHPDNTYVVHYDKRRPAEEHRAIHALAEGKPNILIQKPRAVLWGRFSLYRAQHEGLRLAIDSGRSWSHWINLSGQCYPLVPIEGIQQACSEAGEHSFVRHFEPLVNGDWPHPQERLTGYVLDSVCLEWWLRLPGIGRRLRRIFGGESSLPRLPGIRRALPKTFTWFGGDNWVVLSRAAAEHLVLAAKAATIIAALRHSAIPDESVFQTVLMNSPFSAQVINQHRRLINWRHGMASPTVFTTADWPALMQGATDGNWFARKFEAASPILDMIDAHLLHRTKP